MQYNVHGAKSNLSRPVELAERGEEVVIARAGKPVVKLVCLLPGDKPVLGSAAAKIQVRPGWDEAMTAEKLAEFLGQ